MGSGWLARRREEKEKKEYFFNKIDEAIENLEVPQLKKICLDIIGRTPKGLVRKDPKSGNEYQITDPITIDEYVWLLADSIQKELITLERIRDYLTNHKLVPNGFFTFESKTNDVTHDGSKKDEFTTIIETIRKEFKPERPTDEEHLQSQLVQFMRTQFKKEIQREAPARHNDKVDILLDNRFAFEVKLPSDRTALRNLMAQLEEYQEQYPLICAIIFNNEDLNLTNDINDYSERYKQKLGIPTIIISGNKRG